MLAIIILIDYSLYLLVELKIGIIRYIYLWIKTTKKLYRFDGIVGFLIHTSDQWMENSFILYYLNRVNGKHTQL